MPTNPTPSPPLPPDTSLFAKCGVLDYDPFDKSAGGAGPNEARNSQISGKSNARLVNRLGSSSSRRRRRIKRVLEDGEEDRHLDEGGGGSVTPWSGLRNRIVNGEVVRKNRPWIVAVYRGIAHKGREVFVAQPTSLASI